MRKPLLAALALVMFVSACGAVRESRLNPFNWFKRSETVAVAEVTPGAVQDPRPLAEQITALKVEPASGGAILRVTALPPTQGWWDAELVKRSPDENGARIYDFRMSPPKGQAGVNTPRSREITAAVFLTTRQLQEITSITVQAATNGMTSRR